MYPQLITKCISVFMNFRTTGEAPGVSGNADVTGK